jgi:hypothetical protein
MPVPLRFLSDLTIPGLPEPLLALLVVMHERCDGMVACHCPCAGRVLVVRQAAQLNGCDCGVWTLYALYWRCLRRAIKQDKRHLFADMGMKDPNDALMFSAPRHLLLVAHDVSVLFSAAHHLCYVVHGP